MFKCVEMEVPELISPQSGSTGLPASPRVTWNPVPGAFRYDVFMDTGTPPGKVAAEDIGTTTFSPSNLLPLTTYYWKVVAKGDPFCEPCRSATSEVWSFTTTSECDVPGEFEGLGE